MTAPNRMLTAEQILDVGRKLLELRPVDEVLKAVVEAAATAMNADTVQILLYSRESDSWEAAAGSQQGDEEPRRLEQISRTIIEEAVLRNEPILTESAVEDPRFSRKSSVILQQIQSAVVIPLARKDGVEGVIYLDSRSDRGLFHQKNLAPLSSLAAISSLAIENARRYETARREISQLRGDRRHKYGLLVGSSPAMQELYAMIDRVAATALPVLITGESGTGKELVARQIHAASDRREKPFLALYCGNVSPELFESELFGHKKGSFTGASFDKEGLVHAAKGGTLFLDEVADIPFGLQAKLLRFLQDYEYRAVGDTATVRADVRIVAATNRNLEQEISAGRFREDLFYRLYILPVTVPPLRDRLSDVPHLVKYFLHERESRFPRPGGISPDALRKLMAHKWPGNVRELENTIARASVVAAGERIEVCDILHQQIRNPETEDGDFSWRTAERKHILHVLSLCEGNKSRAARELGVSRRYLHYRMKEWNLVKQRRDSIQESVSSQDPDRDLN